MSDVTTLETNKLENSFTVKNIFSLCVAALCGVAAAVETLNNVSGVTLGCSSIAMSALFAGCGYFLSKNLESSERVGVAMAGGVIGLTGLLGIAGGTTFIATFYAVRGAVGITPRQLLKCVGSVSKLG